MNYVFGVDAGGTKTICAIGDTSGRLLAVGEGGPANYKLVGSEAAQGASAGRLQMLRSGPVCRESSSPTVSMP